MDEKQEKWACAHCGYTADGRFEGDICPNCGLTYWKCAKCGFLITAAKPPDTCPECGESVISSMSLATPRSVGARVILIAGCKTNIAEL